MGFSEFKVDVSLFFQFSGSHVILLLVYVDNILITGSRPEFIAQLTRDLHVEFSLKNLGDATYFLRVQITCCDDTFHLRQ